MRARLVVAVVLGLVAAACASGPSSDDLRPPTSVTTTEAPEEGVVEVRITNGSWQPPTLKMDLAKVTLVRFLHDDDPSREYLLISSDDLFEPVPMAKGDEFEWDFADIKPKIYRFSAQFGFNRAPLSIDTRPEI